MPPSCVRAGRPPSEFDFSSHPGCFRRQALADAALAVAMLSLKQLQRGLLIRGAGAHADAPGVGCARAAGAAGRHGGGDRGAAIEPAVRGLQPQPGVKVRLTPMCE